MLLCLLYFDNHPKSRLILIDPIGSKETNEKTDTTTEDGTNFNSETHRTHFTIIMKEIYEIDLIT